MQISIKSKGIVLCICILTNSEQVGGQTHSMPMLLSFSAAMLSGGFKLENTSNWEYSYTHIILISLSITNHEYTLKFHRFY